MGPKTFIACYVCLKEFGSKSITFHEPKCLERWRSSNKSLPSDKRTPTPVKPPVCDSTQDWVCSNCRKSVPAKRKSEHISVCSPVQSGDDLFAKRSIAKNLKSIDNRPNKRTMTGVVKTEFSPKKGKENKNNSNHIPVGVGGSRKNAKNDAKPESKDIGDKVPQEQNYPEIVEITSTSDRSVRPQTKILRRPTPNLNHPVIHMDSDDSSGDSSCSDKSKEDNPKRLKMGNESSSSDSAHKPKNFIIYNKNNVEKNTIKNSPKERASANAVPTIPNPCNSCNRSLAPERLHSHAKKDSRGLMYRKSPSLDIKAMSPQQKLAPTPDKSPTLDIKMISPPQKIPEISNKSTNMDVKMASPSQKIPEITNKLTNMDVKMSSPPQKIPEISNKSSTMDVKMASPRKKASDPSEKSDIKMCFPQQKLSKLIMKPSSLDIKPIYHPKTPDACAKPLSSEGKIPKLIRLDKSSSATDVKSQQKQTDASDKQQQHSDVKMASPKKRMSRSYKVLNKINKPVQSEQCVKDDGDSKDRAVDTVLDSLTVPGSVSTSKEEEAEKACYICLKEFKASALQMHESKCLETWKKENNSLNPNLRKLPPRRPVDDSNDDDEIEGQHDEDDPAWTSVQSQLVPCELCSRTFFPERLPVHRRVCKGKSSPRPLKRAASLREQSASSTDGEDSKPAVYVPCYVCGRNYGSWVITMHEQQCLKKWRRENDKLPDDEQQEEPKRFPDFSPDDDVTSLAELGDNAWESHLQHLVPCPLCSRTFFPDRLGVHKRSCKGPPTTSSRRPRSNKGA